MTGTRTRTALVIGGGIAGPATAMALQHAGIEATVYESHAAGAEGIGAFLTLASNGIDALRAWHSGRMIVIGDAAHAPSPSSGQGASLSIEDAVVLAKSLRDLSTPQAAFAGSRRRAGPGSSASSNGPPASTTAKQPTPSPACSATPCCR